MSTTQPVTRRTTRVSLLRLTVVAVVAGALVWATGHAVSAAIARVTPPGATTFAPYVDVTATPTYPFETPAGPAQSQVTLAFIVSRTSDACVPTWGGYYNMTEADQQLQLGRRIAQLRLTGGDVRISFGGQRGVELATSCTDPAALADAYRSVVSTYHVASIDFDLEGVGLDDRLAMLRRATAIRAVQLTESAAGRHLAVWLTLPVSPTGLTDSGKAAVATMLSAGVEVAGVNGMTMDFGQTTTTAQPESTLIIQAATALQSQVMTAFHAAGFPLDEAQAWSKVGITPMIGQNDVLGERFTLADAAVVNQFVRARSIGLLSMWSLNRDATCTSPLPSQLTVVQTSCSGLDQAGNSYAIALWQDLDQAPTTTEQASVPTASGVPTSTPTAATPAVDDPAHSPFPVWDPYGTYPGGTNIVWHHNVYQARFWTTGVTPDMTGLDPGSMPWKLVGPVLPGDTPAPLPTLPAHTYPTWSPTQAYTAGSRVQVGLVPYVAKWWTQGQQPGITVPGGSPWLLVPISN